MSSPLRREVVLLEQRPFVGDVVDGPGERRLEAGEVGAALVGVDVVDEGERVLVVAVLVLEGDVDLDVVLGGGERRSASGAASSCSG